MNERPSVASLGYSPSSAGNPAVRRDVAELVYELLDAHDDTARLAGELEADVLTPDLASSHFKTVANHI